MPNPSELESAEIELDELCIQKAKEANRISDKDMNADINMRRYIVAYFQAWNREYGTRHFVKEAEPECHCAAPGCQCDRMGLHGALTEQVGGEHYKNMKIQPVEFILANGIPFVEGCVIKYLSRWRDKNGVEDLKKARHFLDMLIEHEERKHE